MYTKYDCMTHIILHDIFCVKIIVRQKFKIELEKNICNKIDSTKLS